MRYIALREFRPGLAATVTPPHAYIEKTNGTLQRENVVFRVDQDGFMVSERPLGDADIPILLLGGSSIENIYIPDGKRILDRIESGLRELRVPSKVYSAGISDAHLLHMINLLLNKGVVVRPGMVIYYSAPSLDIEANEADEAFWDRSNPLLSPVKENKPDPPVKYADTFVNKHGFTVEARLLRVLCDVCRAFDAVPFLATWPLFGEYDEFFQRACPNREVFDAEIARCRQVNDVVRKVAREKGAVLIELADAFAKLRHGEYFYDQNHPNVAGCQRIADLTCSAVRKFLANYSPPKAARGGR